MLNTAMQPTLVPRAADSGVVCLRAGSDSKRRATMVDDLGAWPWSSYLAMIGAQPVPAWLATDGLLAAFGKRCSHAVRRYMEFVAQGVNAEPIWQHLKSQMFLGDDRFVAQSLKSAKSKEDVLNKFSYYPTVGVSGDVDYAA